jgi:hypothetical protein
MTKAVVSVRKYFQRATSVRPDQTALSRNRKTALVSIRLPVELKSQIEAMTIRGVATHCYPWRTYTETYRALILRGLEAMRHDDPDVAETYLELQRIEYLASLKQSREQAMAAWESAAYEIDELLLIENEREALSVFQSVKRSCQQTGGPWSDWLVKKLTKAYPKLDGRPLMGISLLTRVVDDDEAV